MDRQRALFGGALSNGGNLFEWMSHTLRLDADPAVEAALRALPPDGHGLTMLPFFAGERSPGWNSNARAAIIGLSLATPRSKSCRPGLEAVAYRFALIYRGLVAQVPAAQRFVASGGGLLHSPAWMQIMADVLGHPVTASTVDEASSRGNVLLALEALGVIPRAGALPPGWAKLTRRARPIRRSILPPWPGTRRSIPPCWVSSARPNPPVGYDHRGPGSVSRANSS